ncbi:MAG: PAS/PAC domain-containing protein [Ignavibacteria bacterium]|nr:MAG: PAS/PAC domain-containing protein [Ignavibacteria bacterium]KAF0161035.1 MAG: PAS/PAC domain-containing protein [Ignavibacteria bacterium]
MHKVLIVDDKAENIYLLKALMDTINLETIAAGNGKEALELAKQSKPNIIISDILMPVMDGYSFCRECKKDILLKNIPFIFYTATYTDPQDKEFALSLGASMFILKPQEPDVFLEIVHNVLNQVKNCTFVVNPPQELPESVILKQYNAALIRKLEDKLLETERAEKLLRKSTERLQKEINERRKTENSLLESEKKYRTIFENVQDVFYQVKLDGTISELSPSIKYYSDFSRDELLGSHISNLYYEPEDRTTFLKKIKEIGELRDYELRIKSKTGKMIYASINARLIFDADGKPDHIDGAIRDITARKLAQEELIASEDRMRMLVEGTPHLFFYTQDTNANITYVSPTVEVITGYTVEQWLGQKHWFVSNSKINALATEKTKLHLTGQITSEPILVEIVHSNGSIVTLEVYEKPIIKNDLVIGLQGVAHDITERKKSQSQIKLLNRSLEQSPVSVLITDLSGNIEYANSKFSETTGFSTNETIGKNPRIVKSGMQSPEFYKNLWDTILAGNDWRGELHNKKKNGEMFWEDVFISPVKDEQGIVTHFVAIKEDVTEKKKILTELIEAKQKAEEMSRLKSNFMANMSHELRTPLIGLLGISEFMVEEYEGECKANAEIIHASGIRLLTTIAEILDFAKLESKNFSVSLSVFNLTKLLTDEITLYKKTAALNGISLIEKFPNEDIMINSDERLLREVVDNLINNAIKFTNQGSVTVSVIRTDNQIVIKIADTGIGIPKDKYDYIFEEFRQISEGMGRGFEGTGLGLTIVKKFLHLLNGSIEVESEIGAGSTFTILLPVSNTHISNKENINTKENLITAVDLSKNRKYKILLVEDDLINCKVIETMLKKHYNIFSVNNGYKAIEEAKNQTFDIILMDINLKEKLNGLQAAQFIREINGYENKPIVAMTAYASSKDRDEFLSSGCSHYISKPFSQKDILNLLNDITKDFQK